MNLTEPMSARAAAEKLISANARLKRVQAPDKGPDGVKTKRSLGESRKAFFRAQKPFGGGQGGFYKSPQGVYDLIDFSQCVVGPENDVRKPT
jgi:hypothetical protein